MNLRTKFQGSLLLFIFCYSGLNAQNNLMKEVTIGQMSQQRMSSVLKQISRNGHFNFAYNNHIVPADSIVSLSGYRGTIYNLLNKLLGADYEFKEVPGYIVLRHAPGRLNLTAEIDGELSGQFTIKGHVTDASDHKEMKQVSIYEKNLLLSTLTNEQGYFELKLTSYKGPFILTATKENYRDTSLYLLHNVNVNPKTSKRAYKYYPEDEHRSRFVRLFISSKQRIQDLNLGGFFAYSPYQVSLTPGLSSHGMYNSQVINHFSFNMMGGYTAGVEGVEFAGFFNIDRKDVSYFQVAGLFNTVGGNLSGLQLAGTYNNVGNDVHGVQIAGIMNKARKVKGVQLAGLINMADSSDYPIAVINLIKNGNKNFALGTDELLFTHIDFRSGGRVLYGLIGFGYKFNTNDRVRYAFELGLGAHLIHADRFRLDGEYVSQTALNFNDPYQLSAFKLLTSYRFTKHLGFYAGPSFNFLSSSAADHLAVGGWQLHQSVNGSTISDIHIGFSGGLQWSW